MQKIPAKQKFIYTQGLANLALEAMTLNAEQNSIAQNYQTGQITKREMLKKALEYARAR